MDADWKIGPKTGTICTAIGWGALYEKGPGPDHLHEVSVPIIQRCKSPLDNIGGSICAGEPQGGRDACQGMKIDRNNVMEGSYIYAFPSGDSGGPFLCRSERDSTEWYLAGIISHGDGCARADEPGVYTRVSLYLEWIEEVVEGQTKVKNQPLLTCPGYTCIWGGERCIARSRRCDGKINCLGGEDEVDCIFEESVGAGLNETTLAPEALLTQDDQVDENLIEEDPILPNVLENIPMPSPTKTSTSTTITTTSTTSTTSTESPTTTKFITTTNAPIDSPKILNDLPTTLATVEITTILETTAPPPDPPTIETTTTTQPMPPKELEIITQKDTSTLEGTTICPVSSTASSFDGESRGEFGVSPLVDMFDCKK